MQGMAASGGPSGYKPGHKSKGSISSLRGNGGHSLFSGHHKSMASGAEMSQSGVSGGAHQHPHHHFHLNHHHQHRQTPPAIAEENVPEQNGDESGEASPTQETGANDVHSGTVTPVSQQLPTQTEENSSLEDNSPTVSSTYPAVPVTESGRSRAFTTSATSNGMGSSGPFDAGSSNSVYKKSSHARTLPHLHLHDDKGMNDHQHGHHDHGFSSLFPSNNSVQTIRPPEPRSHVAMLQPMMAKGIHVDPLAGITFREDAIMTSDRRGHIKVWKRPPLVPQHP